MIASPAVPTMQPPPQPNRPVVGRPPPDVRPGRVIADKYRIERELGRGGFGVVVRAVHLTLHQSVAIKVLTEGEGNDADWAEDAERFRREAQATAALRSDHVVRILDVDVLPEGAPYIVMEYLGGETLHHAIHARGPLAIEEAVDCAIQTLAALAEAHGAGIVHRDLKPANVFLAKGLDRLPVVKVLDFGVSKVGGGGQAITRTGAVIGTVAYMAPEQMLDAKRVDGRADLWSVGQILYEALSRQLPFGPFTSPTIVTSILTNPPVPLAAVRPGVPPALDAIVMRCLEKDAARRFQTAAELALALAPFASARSRMALESIQRAPTARGAAAPGPNLPSRPSYGAIGPAGARRVTDPPPRAATSASLVPLAVAFAVGTVILGAVAWVIHSRSQAAEPEPQPVPAVSEPDRRK